MESLQFYINYKGDSRLFIMGFAQKIKVWEQLMPRKMRDEGGVALNNGGFDLIRSQFCSFLLNSVFT